jgi:hypothetical protein
MISTSVWGSTADKKQEPKRRQRLIAQSTEMGENNGAFTLQINFAQYFNLYFLFLVFEHVQYRGCITEDEMEFCMYHRKQKIK